MVSIILMSWVVYSFSSFFSLRWVLIISKVSLIGDNKITNLTNVKLTRNDLEVLNLGYKYNFPSTNSTHIKQNMIAEAQLAINEMQIDDIQDDNKNKTIK